MKKIKAIIERYRPILFDYRIYAVVMMTDVIIRLMGVGTALLYGELINKVAAGLSFAEMLPMIFFVVGYILVYAGFKWLSCYIEDFYANKAIYHLRNVYIGKLFGTKLSMVSKEDSSRYINNLTNDCSNIVYNYAFNSIFFVSSVVAVAGSFIAALMLNWKIALSMLAFTGVMAILPFFIKRPLDKSIYRVSEKRKEYIRSLKENLLGIAVIKNNVGTEVCQEEIKGHNTRMLAEQKKNIFINSIAGGMGCLIRDVATVSLIILTCYFVSINEVQIGAVLSIFSIGSGFYGGILGCSSVVTNLVSMKSLRDNVTEILDYPSVAYGESIDIADGVRLENVSFSYPNAERPILKNINLFFGFGKKYLVIGKSGSGKSTILKLVCKFYENFEGEITLDGKPYRDLTEKQVNEAIAYSQQNCYLFHRSLRENIDFNKSENKEKLARVIAEVQLQQFVDLLPEGIETVIDEEVNQVSGGEKLRISLARSLYRDSRMLLLDEVTSALDKKTSETVEKNILAVKDKTIVNVCHKFNDKTLPLYDRIFVIEDGEIVLSGTFEELKDDPKLLSYRNIGDEKKEETQA